VIKRYIFHYLFLHFSFCHVWVFYDVWVLRHRSMDSKIHPIFQPIEKLVTWKIEWLWNYIYLNWNKASFRYFEIFKFFPSEMGNIALKGQDFKIYGSNIKVLSQVTCIWNTKTLSLTIQKIWPMLKFLKSGSNFKVKVTKSKFWYQLKGLVIRHTHMKCESPITCHSNDMANVNVFKTRPGQPSRSRGQTFWYQYYRKVLS
jgi:hypothetical protein